MRGARRYGYDEFDLSLYTPEHWEHPKGLANIVSQNCYRFSDLNESDCIDNYDETARTLDGLKDAMNNVYSNFEEREIVTILRFEVV